MTNTTIFLIDNFDSFTYNLVDELRCMNYQIVVYRNNIAAEFIFDKMRNTNGNVILMLSPGPGNPKQAGCVLKLIEKCKGVYPIIGICLGHQAIIESYGGEIINAESIVHGKSSAVEHFGDKMFSNLPQPLQVARYHSLCANETKMPSNLTIIAHYQNIVMAVYQAEDNVLGFQFHPESILTTQGAQLLQQSLQFLEHRRVV